ncbi:MAG: plasmid pRiA4b ORF-3 family protein [Cyclobacteriaceae bacterium]|nr:plasmid pRiA4b ORF-3 family protein [Cyclobacteriaceae bacterium]
MKIVRLPIANPPIKLKINLENMPVSVFRRMLVPADINMMQLHYVIQIAMGWEFAHLFQFSDKKYRGSITVKVPFEDDFDFADNIVKPEKVSLKGIFQELRNSKPFYYEYDFGDSWLHKITFQKPSKKDSETFAGVPVCVDAFGACPPEDVGGPWGYTDFLDAINNKKHPEYEEFREWVDLAPKEKYDEEYVDLESVNESLLGYSQAEEWNAKSDNYFS